MVSDVSDRSEATRPMVGGAQPDRSGWRSECWARMRRDFVWKAIGICGFMWLFFYLYFQVLRHPVFPVTVMPLTALDGAIGFTPQALPLYVSLWLYVGFAPGLTATLREALVYAAWAAGLCAVGLLLFYLFPTAVPLPAVAVDTVAHPGFALLQGVDAAGNACPSLHVATAVFTAAWINRLLAEMRAPAWLRVGNVAWMLLITWSTLAVKQHVVLDAVAGAALGLAWAWLSLRGRTAMSPSA